MRHVVRFGAEQLTKMDHNAGSQQSSTSPETNFLDIEQILSGAEEVNYEDLSQNKFGKLPGNIFQLSDLSPDKSVKENKHENDQDFWRRIKDTIAANTSNDGARQITTGPLEQLLSPESLQSTFVQFSFLQTREIMKIVKLLRRFGTTTNAHIQQIYSMDKTIATTLVSDINLKHFCDSILELCKRAALEEIMILFI